MVNLFQSEDSPRALTEDWRCVEKLLQRIEWSLNDLDRISILDGLGRRVQSYWNFLFNQENVMRTTKTAQDIERSLQTIQRLSKDVDTCLYYHTRCVKVYKEQLYLIEGLMQIVDDWVQEISKTMASDNPNPRNESSRFPSLDGRTAGDFFEAAQVEIACLSHRIALRQQRTLDMGNEILALQNLRNACKVKISLSSEKHITLCLEAMLPATEACGDVEAP